MALPGLGSVSGFNGSKHDDPALYFGFENYAQPPTLYRFEPKSGAISLSIAPRRPCSARGLRLRAAFHQSKRRHPGAAHHQLPQGLKLDGSNPTILYGWRLLT